jgi:wyosine [tRNA(Phe)-imidazoG37] synthetase (radical SAM superfamily)
LGRTTPLSNERREFFPPEAILVEVQAAVDKHQPGEIDYITIVGQGEPLLSAGLGQLISEIKVLTSIPVALITNGSLLFKPEIRAEVSLADVVIPTLDAADEATFRRINRPWPGLKIAEIIEGMVTLRKIFKGQLWLEVMLVKGVNDTEKALNRIADALRRIRPDQVHLNVPLRPPAESWVEVPDAGSMVRAMAMLGEVAPIVTPAQGAFGLTGDMPVADAIIEIIRRHPIQETNLLEILDCYAGSDQVSAILDALETGGQARRHIYRGQVFWEYAGGRFANP